MRETTPPRSHKKKSKKPDVPPKSGKYRDCAITIDHSPWSDDSIQYSSVRAAFGLPEGGDVQEAREMLCINWAQLKRATDSLRGPLNRVLAEGGEALDPAGHTLSGPAYATRRMEQRVLLDAILLCGPVFEKLEHVFAMEDLLVIPAATTCLGYISSVGETSGWPELAAIMRWSPSSLHQDRPLGMLRAIMGLSCLTGLRLSPEHWEGRTVPQFAHDCTGVEYRVPAGAACAVCNQPVGEVEEEEGMIITRRCANRTQSPGVRRPCEGDACDCCSRAKSKYYHAHCLGRHLYAQGGRAKCPSCGAEFCLLDMTRVTFKSAAKTRPLRASGWINPKRRRREKEDTH